MEAYRQGDVLIVRIDEGERSNFKQNRGAAIHRERGQGLVLAEGEATGHAHRVVSSRARLRRHITMVAGRRTTHTCLYVGPGGAVVEHEEHAPIHLAPGKYEVRRQSEYTPTSEERARETSTRMASRTWVAD